MGKVRGAGAEPVERGTDADVTDRRHWRDHAVERCAELALRQLDDEVRGLDLVAVEDKAQLRDEAGIHEVAEADVDRQPEPVALQPPDGQLPARLVEDPSLHLAGNTEFTG